MACHPTLSTGLATSLKKHSCSINPCHAVGTGYKPFALCFWCSLTTLLTSVITSFAWMLSILTRVWVTHGKFLLVFSLFGGCSGVTPTQFWLIKAGSARVNSANEKQCWSQQWRNINALPWWLCQYRERKGFPSIVLNLY